MEYLFVELGTTAAEEQVNLSLGNIKANIQDSKYTFQGQTTDL